MIGLYNHLLSKVLRSHYHSQKVIGSLGPGHWALEDCCFLFPKMVGLHPQLESVTGAQPWISSTLGDPPWVFDIEGRQQKQMIVALLHMARAILCLYIWSNYSDLTRPHPKWCFSKGNPLILLKSGLVNYFHFTRYVLSHIYKSKCQFTQRIPSLKPTICTWITGVGSEEFRAESLGLVQRSSGHFRSAERQQSTPTPSEKCLNLA